MSMWGFQRCRSERRRSLPLAFIRETVNIEYCNLHVNNIVLMSLKPSWRGWHIIEICSPVWSCQSWRKASQEEERRSSDEDFYLHNIHVHYTWNMNWCTEKSFHWQRPDAEITWPRGFMATIHPKTSSNASSCIKMKTCTFIIFRGRYYLDNFHDFWSKWILSSFSRVALGGICILFHGWWGQRQIFALCFQWVALCNTCLLSSLFQLLDYQMVRVGGQIW